jgi:NAD(P)H-hydrate epimerase
MADSAPPLRPFSSTAVFLPTGAQAAAFDRYAIDERGVPHFTLMENAGRSAALVLERLFPHGPVVALVGAGNNGGDALVVLRNLAAWGRDVRGVLVADRAPPEVVLHGWDLPLVQDAELSDDGAAWDLALSGAGVLVDGLLGTGLSGAPRERQVRAIEAANRSDAPVFSLDAPSGADAGTGALPGAAIRADVTVALGWPKLGCLLHPARAVTGRLIAVEIGFPDPGPDRFPARLITPTWADRRRPARALATHKNAVGNALIVAGGDGMAGAAVLASRAAIRSGAGYVRVASTASNRAILQEAVPDAVFVDRSDRRALLDAVAAAGSVVLGPGMGTGDEAASVARAVFEAAADRPVLLDADVLTLSVGGGGPSVEDWARRGPTLVTPHPGEMARLMGTDAEAVNAARIESAESFAASTGAVTLLKGAPSVVAHPDGRLLVDAMGSSDLAAAGMGDVLSGVIGSLFAQGLSVLDGAGAGLCWSGRSAWVAGKGAGLSPSDVVEALPEVMAEQGPGATELDFPFILLDLDPPR